MVVNPTVEFPDLNMSRGRKEVVAVRFDASKSVRSKSLQLVGNIDESEQEQCFVLPRVETAWYQTATGYLIHSIGVLWPRP